jgi:hypothetical protein
LEKEPCLTVENANTDIVSCNTLWFITADGAKFKIASDVIGRYDLKLWVPNSNLAFYVLENGDVYKFDADSQSSHLIDGIKAKIPLLWVAVGDNFIIHAATPNYTFNRVSISQKKYIDTVLIPADDKRGGVFNFEGLSVSPSNRYLQLGDAQSLYDHTKQAFLPIAQHSASTYAGKHSTYYEWSPQEKWLITGEVIFQAGGGGGPRGAREPGCRAERHGEREGCSGLWRCGNGDLGVLLRRRKWCFVARVGDAWRRGRRRKEKRRKRKVGEGSARYEGLTV